MILHFWAYCAENKETTLTLDGEAVHSLRSVALWAIAALTAGDFDEMDTLSIAIRPYLFCIPLALINHGDIPLDLGLDPSESEEMSASFAEAIVARGLERHQGVLSFQTGKTIMMFIPLASGIGWRVWDCGHFLPCSHALCCSRGIEVAHIAIATHIILDLVAGIMLKKSSTRSNTNLPPFLVFIPRYPWISTCFQRQGMAIFWIRRFGTEGDKSR
jgi:hypothetical protein